MAPKKHKPTAAEKAEAERLSDEEVFKLADEYQAADQKVKRFSQVKSGISKRLTEELARRKTKKLTSKSGRQVTFVQKETIEYDEEGIWKDLTPRQRPKVFVRYLALEELSPEERKTFMDDFVKSLPRSTQQRVMKHKLDEAKLLKAIEDEVVTAEWVAEHSETVKSKPYVVISGG